MAEGYRTTRGVLGFVAFVGWVIAVVGAVLAVLPLIGEGSDVTIGLGVLIVAVGLVQVGAAQMSFAVLDTADRSREILEEIRGLRADRALAAMPPPAGRSLSGGRQEPVLSRSDRPAPQAAPEDNLPTSFVDRGERRVVKVQGVDVVHEDDRWHALGQSFDTLGEAKAAVKAVQEDDE